MSTVTPTSPLSARLKAVGLSAAQFINPALAQDRLLGEGQEARVVLPAREHMGTFGDTCIRSGGSKEAFSDDSVLNESTHPLSDQPNIGVPIAYIHDPKKTRYAEILRRLPGFPTARPYEGAYAGSGMSRDLKIIIPDPVKRQAVLERLLKKPDRAKSILIPYLKPDAFFHMRYDSPEKIQKQAAAALKFQRNYPRMLKALADMPQDAYDDAARAIVTAYERGQSIDFMHGNNVFITSRPDMTRPQTKTVTLQKQDGTGTVTREVTSYPSIRTFGFIEPKPQGNPFYDMRSHLHGMLQGILSNGTDDPFEMLRAIENPKKRAEAEASYKQIAAKINDAKRRIQDPVLGPVFAKQKAEDDARFERDIRRIRIRKAAPVRLYKMKFKRAAKKLLGKGWLWGRSHKPPKKS